MPCARLMTRCRLFLGKRNFDGSDRYRLQRKMMCLYMENTMRTATMFVATLCFALSGAAFADTYKLDAAAKCRDDRGKFAEARFCHA